MKEGRETVLRGYMDQMWTLTAAESKPNSLESLRVWAPASVSFRAQIFREVCRSQLSTCVSLFHVLLEGVSLLVETRDTCTWRLNISLMLR